MIKKVLIILFICLVGVAGALIYKKPYSHRISLSSPTPKLNIATNRPEILDIPSIDVHANVESVGLDAQNRMDIPKNWDNVAWYNLGPHPGAAGNSVIDGHVDTTTGAPAVFARLSELKEGDTITVVEGNITHMFRVTSLEAFDTNNFPLQRVFGSSDSSYLNLITCDGIWNKDVKSYSKRLVVFSKLIK
ncbi:MAG TPA: class F sortase [Patescibacteria group bacterium]|nr:class F sortase [Patescibacteria group bacterium]